MYLKRLHAYVNIKNTQSDSIFSRTDQAINNGNKTFVMPLPIRLMKLL